MVQVHLGPPKIHRIGASTPRNNSDPLRWIISFQSLSAPAISQEIRYRVAVKKLLILGIVAGVGYVVYRQVMANRAEQDLWSEATAEPDLR